jgi:hypothetical protein
MFMTRAASAFRQFRLARSGRHLTGYLNRDASSTFRALAREDGKSLHLFLHLAEVQQALAATAYTRFLALVVERLVPATE